jgi:hypothetical protein
MIHGLLEQLSKRRLDHFTILVRVIDPPNNISLGGSTHVHLVNARCTWPRIGIPEFLDLDDDNVNGLEFTEPPERKTPNQIFFGMYGLFGSHVV